MHQRLVEKGAEEMSFWVTSLVKGIHAFKMHTVPVLVYVIIMIIIYRLRRELY